MNDGLKKGLVAAAASLVFLGSAGGSITAINHYNSPERFINTEITEVGSISNYLETLDGIYIGDVNGQDMGGNGSLAFNTGEVLKGTFDENGISGEGTLSIPGVGKYEGAYENNVRSGEGVFTWENGDVLTCKWENDQPKGEGTLKFANGNVLKGTFSGTTVTEGTLTVEKDKISYGYKIKNNKPTNQIEITTADGTTVSGPFSEGKLNGTYTINYSNGDTYTGSIVDNKRSGKGTYTWSGINKKYEGEWSNDLFNGTGSYQYNAFDVLSGTWQNGVPTGKMKLSYRLIGSGNNAEYTAEFKDGKCTKIS